MRTLDDVESTFRGICRDDIATSIIEAIRPNIEPLFDNLKWDLAGDTKDEKFGHKRLAMLNFYTFALGIAADALYGQPVKEAGVTDVRVAAEELLKALSPIEIREAFLVDYQEWYHLQWVLNRIIDNRIEPASIATSKRQYNPDIYFASKCYEHLKRFAVTKISIAIFTLEVFHVLNPEAVGEKTAKGLANSI